MDRTIHGDGRVVYATTLFATALPIKIWNSNRNEKEAGAAADAAE